MIKEYPALINTVLNYSFSVTVVTMSVQKIGSFYFYVSLRGKIGNTALRNYMGFLAEQYKRLYAILKKQIT